MKKLSILSIILAVSLLVFFTRSDVFQQKVSEPKIIFSSGTFRQGDTLWEVLLDRNISYPEIIDITRALNTHFYSRRIRPGAKYEIYKSTTNEVFEFNLWHNPVEYFNIIRSTYNNRFYCRKKIVPSTKTIVNISGKITSSLYESFRAKKISPETIMKFADIFAWQVDFLTETRGGDSFFLAYEQQRFENGIVRDKNILIAKYTGRKSGTHKGIYFEYSGGSGYFDIEGNSLRKKFLRAPLNYRRISSHFTHSRLHPILRRWMPSLAIDYAAPTGTPVVSVGDGVVTYAGWGKTRLRRGLGLHVIVRHSSVYSTWYSHLSRLPRGIKKGAKVRQGQVIGFVGSTGLSTGPHLDFRIKKRGEFVNFLALDFPSDKSIPKKYREKFNKVVSEKLQLLNDSRANNSERNKG